MLLVAGASVGFAVLAAALILGGLGSSVQHPIGAHLVSAGMHHGGCQSFYLGALNVGQALVIMGRFDPEEALRLIERHRVTTAYMVPTQFVRLLRLPAEVRAKYDHSSLQSVVHASFPLRSGSNGAAEVWITCSPTHSPLAR